MRINKKHFFTSSRWIVFNSGRADRRSRPQGRSFYGESSASKSASEFSEKYGRNTGSGNLSGVGGLRRNQEGIPLRGGPQRQCFRGYAVRGDLGKARQQQPGSSDGHARFRQSGGRTAAKWQSD